MDCSALSPSRISTYKNCEFKYFLEYHLRYPDALGDNIYGIKGTAAHDALEYYVNFLIGKKEKSSQNYEQVLKDFYSETELWKLDDRPYHKGFPHPVEKNCEACPWATKDSYCSIAQIPFKDVEGCPRPNFEDDLEIVRSTIESDEYPIYENNKLLCAEQEFKITLEGGAKIRGKIDLVVERLDQEGCLEIIDYKTGNSTLSYEAARAHPQTRIYSLVAKRLYPDYSTYMTTLYYNRRKRMVSCVFTDEDDKDTLRAINKKWEEIRSNEDPARPRSSFWLCNFCIGHEHCGVIKSSLTKNGKFKLPTVQCKYANDLCWGYIRAEEPNRITASELNNIVYACQGHYEIHKGGSFVSEG